MQHYSLHIVFVHELPCGFFNRGWESSVTGLHSHLFEAPVLLECLHLFSFISSVFDGHPLRMYSWHKLVYAELGS